jgi:nucleoside-diphosphate-sugar epimerase
VEAITAVAGGRVSSVPEALLAPPAWLGSALGALGVGFPLTRDRLRKLTARLTFSSARIADELGYRPVAGFEDGIREAVRDRS